jgi:2-polyprenyl-3-methyl-5-hydroxy-6-metoxy-1,4-benzoquinol methylase
MRPVRTSRDRRLAADASVAEFFGLVRDELRRYDPAGRTSAELRRYLSPQFGPGGEPSPLGVAGYSARVRPLVEVLSSAPAGLRILDAGSGYGTESLLFAWLGADVTAVELVRERHDLARIRGQAFPSRAGVPFRVEFVNANILRFLEGARTFDVIWTMEAISHIYPPERFLALARERLAPGGILAVSDPNRANPVAWLRAVRIRGSIHHEPHREFNDPQSGTPVEYGRELIHSIRAMERLLVRTGFRVEKAQTAGFLASTLVPGSWRNRRVPVALALTLQTAAARIPVLRRFGANYTILARPAA